MAVTQNLGWSQELKDVPIILDELQAIEGYLEPKKYDIQSLITTYIFSSDSHLFRSNVHHNDELGLSLSGFANIEDLVEFIRQNLSIEIVRENLNEFLTSSNHYVRNIGNSVASTYSNIDDFISDLQAIPYAEQPLYNRFFLSGVSKVLIETDWISYTKLINYLISVPSFHIITPRVMAEVSTKKEHFEFIIDKITQYSEVDFDYLGDQLAFQKLHQYITPELFEFVLDEMIRLNEDNIVLEALLFDSRQNKIIADKYIDKILELLPKALNSKVYYDYSHAIRFLLSHSEATRESIFIIVEEAIRDMDYLISLSSSPVGRVIEDMVEGSTRESLNFIYGNDLFTHVFNFREFREIFSKADEAEVLKWIGDDQEKIDFWFANSRFYKNNNEESIEWSDILHKLLSKSSDSQNHLSVIMAPLFEMYSCSGRPSRALSKRLFFFESLKEYLIEHDKVNLLPTVEHKKLEFQRFIEQAQQEEAEDLREQQGFEW
ncbi:hypothetical protein [Psychrobacter celer]|uniref:hypothetical protein n=1 Tax=Psychrobacter celer TaxID=306572 RepID=UPI003FD61868